MADGQGWRWGTCVYAALVVASLGFATRASAEGALASAAAQKAAAKCQTLIAKTGAKTLAAKLKAFDACAAAALACVETKAAKSDCPAKAATTCTKKLASAAGVAAKAETKITTNKSCTALDTTALLGADGLGFGAVAGTCSADLGIDVCGGLAPIAACVVGTHDAAAGPLFGRPAPRTAELLGLLPGAPFTGTADLPSYPGCGNCSAAAGARAGVEKCGKTLNAGVSALAGVLDGAFQKCTLDLYDCIQTKAAAPDCIAKATAGCTKGAAKVAKAGTKLDAAATKGCGTDFASASAATGLNLGVLASRCATLGVTPLDTPAALASCLVAESRCALATLARNALPRTAEFDPATFGGLAGDLGATCPAAALQTSRAAVAPRSIFGSILKIISSVRRPVPSAFGTRFGGGKPTSTGGFGGGISNLSGPVKFKFGSIGKFSISYHGTRSRIGGGGPDITPPTLIVTVSRPDIVIDDHFEIPLLDLPNDGSDVADEIDVQFADSVPACAFNLSFATSTGDGVSDYASILQVLDDEKPVVPTAELVSQGPGGVQQDAPADGINVAISANGRYVAFTSPASNLISPADTNGISDVFVRDRCVADGIAVPSCTPATTLESIGPGDEPFHIGAAGHVGISDDGRYVGFDVFEPSDPDPIIRGFVKDRCISNGTPILMCNVVNEDVTFDGESGTSTGQLTALSSDGRFVAFTSSTSFGPGLPRVFLLDRCVSSSDPVDGGCEPFLNRISNSIAGGEPDGNSDFGAVSRSGRFVAFRSDGTDLLASGVDTNRANDVFLFDTCIDPATGGIGSCTSGTVRVNLGPNDAESVGDNSPNHTYTNVAVSDDGRYVAFVSAADDLVVPGVDTNDKRDVFVRDRCVDPSTGPIAGCTATTERVNLGPGDTESNGDIPDGYVLSMSADARLVVFTSNATNLLGPATSAPDVTTQVFLRDRCLAKGIAIDGCKPTTTLVSTAPDGGLGRGSSDRPAIAAYGSATAFVSSADNLLGSGLDANDKVDVFVKDR